MLDVNWRWLNKGGQNCHKDDATRDQVFCPSPRECAKQCAAEGAGSSATYGIKVNYWQMGARNNPQLPNFLFLTNRSRVVIGCRCGLFAVLRVAQLNSHAASHGSMSEGDAILMAATAMEWI